jgi:hypothetical protein
MYIRRTSLSVLTVRHGTRLKPFSSFETTTSLKSTQFEDVDRLFGKFNQNPRPSQINRESASMKGLGKKTKNLSPTSSKRTPKLSWRPPSKI